MQSSNVGYRKWAAVYIFTTGIKGTSNEAALLSEDGMAHRTAILLRDVEPFTGQVDETYIGGKERNDHEGSKKLKADAGLLARPPLSGQGPRAQARSRRQG